MKLSARNRFPGIITDIKRDGLIAQVEIKAGDNHVVALITSEACDELGLRCILFGKKDRLSDTVGRLIG